MTRAWLVRAMVAAAMLAAAWVAMSRIGPALPGLVARVEGLGAWAGVVFVVLYAVAVTCFLPGSWLTLAAGAIFGLAWGFVYAFTGAVLGSAASFVVARSVARPWVERWAHRSPRFSAIERAVASDGRRIVFLLRLTPLVPFTALNYLLGVTRISLRDVVLASPGMVPGTLLYVYYGRLIGDLTALAAGTPPERGAGAYVLLGVGLIATLVVTVHVSRLARRALDESSDEPPMS